MPEYKYDYFAAYSFDSRLAGLSDSGRIQIGKHQPLTNPKDREGLHSVLSDLLSPRGEMQLAFPTETGKVYGPHWDFLLITALVNHGISLPSAQQIWQNHPVTDPEDRKKLHELMNWLLGLRGPGRSVKGGRKWR
ncbi:MAG TPA: hypothetical protein PLN21_14160 [Gemmatales bacterium]|nr:hypothetical protein [Gemmatales bacterium]